jgi:hypothetical protein
MQRDVRGTRGVRSLKDIARDQDKIGLEAGDILKCPPEGSGDVAFSKIPPSIHSVECPKSKMEIGKVNDLHRSSTASSVRRPDTGCRSTGHRSRRPGARLGRDAAISTPKEHEGARFGVGSTIDHLPDEDRVVARLEPLPQPTIHPSQGVRKEWHPCWRRSGLDSAKPDPGGLNREAVREILVLLAEHGDTEGSRIPNGSQGAGAPIHADEKETGNQGYGCDRVGREADRFALGIDAGDDGHTGGEVSHGLAKVICLQRASQSDGPKNALLHSSFGPDSFVSCMPVARLLLQSGGPSMAMVAQKPMCDKGFPCPPAPVILTVHTGLDNVEYPRPWISDLAIHQP